MLGSNCRLTFNINCKVPLHYSEIIFRNVCSPGVSVVCRQECGQARTARTGYCEGDTTQCSAHSSTVWNQGDKIQNKDFHSVPFFSTSCLYVSLLLLNCLSYTINEWYHVVTNCLGNVFSLLLFKCLMKNAIKCPKKPSQFSHILDGLCMVIGYVA